MGDDVVLGDPIAVSVHAPQRVLRKFVPLVSRQSIPAEGLGVILNDPYAVLVLASQVRWDENVLCLSDETTKTAIARTIPISQRLRAELDMRRTDPMGQPFPMSACVFGNEVGDPIKSVRKAWTKTCKRAGIEGLHLHDLRREFASQLQEAPGVSPHEVATWLGHSNISTTSRYLSTTTGGHLHHTLQKLEKARKRRTNVAQTRSTDETAVPENSREKPQVLDY